MIVAVPKQILSVKQKNLLTKKGYVVIECDEPEKIRIINPEVTIDTNAFMMAALKGCTVNMAVGKTEIFVNELYERLNKKS